MFQLAVRAMIPPSVLAVPLSLAGPLALNLKGKCNLFCSCVVGLYQPSTSSKPQTVCSRDPVDRLIHRLIYTAYLSSDTGLLEGVQRRRTKMIKGLENVFYKGRF